jgi:hypothetical protein
LVEIDFGKGDDATSAKMRTAYPRLSAFISGQFSFFEVFDFGNGTVWQKGISIFPGSLII